MVWMAMEVLCILELAAFIEGILYVGGSSARTIGMNGREKA